MQEITAQAHATMIWSLGGILSFLIGGYLMVKVMFGKENIMSTWKNIRAKDMELDGDEINIFIGRDDYSMGRKYVVVKVGDIKKLLKKVTNTPTMA